MRSILVGLQIFCGVRLEVQHDFGAARDAARVVFTRGRDFKSAAARRRPGPDLVGAGAVAGDDDAIGDNEGGIESDAERADQAGPLLGFGQARQKGPGAGTRDGAEIVDQLLPVHPDATVDDAERIGFLVRRDATFRAASPSAIRSWAAIAP